MNKLTYNNFVRVEQHFPKALHLFQKALQRFSKALQRFFIAEQQFSVIYFVKNWKGQKKWSNFVTPLN